MLLRTADNLRLFPWKMPYVIAVAVNDLAFPPIKIPFTRRAKTNDEFKRIY